ncbi:MAG: hypothetical protein CME62_02505 [Halobacteriovoraceae bacterium]|nr:hypothetical protein [Halobacteriovoraceae bacterium]|tara:strand:+ start:14835 stop:15272 length:438 start_codon:yes stop_codon:yes gene_type:complete
MKGLTFTNIKLVYKKYWKFVNIIFILLVVLIHILIIKNVQEHSEKISQTYEIQKIHLQAEEFLADNLLNECDVFDKGESFQILVDFFDRNDLKLDLVKKRNIKISDLLFSKIYMRSYQDSEPYLEFLTTGYLVTNGKTQKCFGII